MQIINTSTPAFSSLKDFEKMNGSNQVLEPFKHLKTPCYIIDEVQLKRNGQVLSDVMAHTGCKILLAQKAFSNYNFYPLLSDYIAGTEASGLYEARLGREELGSKEVHVFCGAYTPQEFTELLDYADHIVFNSPAQLKKFGPLAKSRNKSLGLRINPMCSTQEGHAIYDPCAPGSRLGTTREVWNREMDADAIALLDGIHFHTLCEQDADALQITLEAVEQQFGDILSLPHIQWLNMGGGHHITRPDYNVSLLEKLLLYAKEKWQLQIYLEPGEAVALNAGYLASRVLDLVENSGKTNGILDVSAACHMPDVLEMPYRPCIYHAYDETENQTGYTYTLGGPTCLSGDVIGTYTFPEPLSEGAMLLFGDMAIYTTCKNNTFNGMPLPSIYTLKEDRTLQLIKEFGYDDFKERLGS